jgi:hypothetical protein
MPSGVPSGQVFLLKYKTHSYLESLSVSPLLIGLNYCILSRCSYLCYCVCYTLVHTGEFIYIPFFLYYSSSVLG